MSSGVCGTRGSDGHSSRALGLESTQPGSDFSRGSAIETGKRKRRGQARKPATILVLSVMLGILAIGIFEAARAMISDPPAPFDMTTEWLERVSVDSYFWPGMFFVGMTLASLVTLAGPVFRWLWSWAGGIEFRIGYRWPWLGPLSTGVVLLVFEVIEAVSRALPPGHAPGAGRLVVGDHLAPVDSIWQRLSQVDPIRASVAVLFVG